MAQALQTRPASLLLLLLPLAAGQLASFDQLRQVYLGTQDTQQSREDRSLTGTYPFNQLNNQGHGAVHHQASVPQYSASQYQAAPASVQRLSLPAQSLNQGFSLLTGFGSNTAAGAYQANHGVGAYQSASATPVYQPASVVPAYQAPPRTAAYQSSALASSPQFQNLGSPSACPYREGLPISQCGSVANACWSVGQADVDCPNHGLCCFDGCANVCLAGGPTVPTIAAPAPIPAPAPVPIPAPAVVEARAPVPARVVPARNPFQARQPLPQTNFNNVAAAGKKCIDKVETVEEIEYDEVEQCDHSYDKQCHTTYVTEYESQQEEECDDNYKKSCEITYSPQAEEVTVQVCMRPLVKDCSISGPEICRTEYISECWTRNDPHLVVDDVASCRTVQEEKCENVQSGYTTEQKCTKWPREVCTVQKERKEKFNPVTKCEKVPQQLCGPAGCGFVPGPEVCHEEVKTVVTDSPEENCDLQPRRTCEHVTKLVPKLSPVEECVDVPKEVCTKAKVNPRTIQKPVTKKWCYVPSEESGLA